MRSFSRLAALVALAAGCSPDSGEDREGARVPAPSDEDGQPSSGGAVNGVGGGFSIADAGAPPADAPLSLEAGCEGVHDTRPQAPTVLIVLDRSASMVIKTDDIDIDRWTPAVSAISGLVGGLEAQIQFGLMTFPSGDDRESCETGELEIAPALGRAADIVAALDGEPASMVAGGTPTRATLEVAGEVLRPIEGSRYVLLVTDGAPNCEPDADTATCECTASQAVLCSGGIFEIGDGGVPVDPEPLLCLDDDATVAAVSALAEDDIRTFVVGYDTLEWSPTLDRMAAAGGTERETHYPVSGGAELAEALEAISAFVVACTFELSEAPPDYRYVSVSIDGRRVPHAGAGDGARDGWVLHDGRVVELVGSACAQVSDGEEHDVRIVRECEPVVR